MSVSRHSFGEREQQNLEFLVAAALEEDLGSSAATSRPWRQSPPMPEVPPDSSPDRLACSPGLPAVELLSRKFEPNPIWHRDWPTATASKLVAWSGASPVRCARCSPSSERHSISCSD